MAEKSTARISAALSLFSDPRPPTNDSRNYNTVMACDHIGPAELIDMAEAQLRERGVRPEAGMCFRWSENPADGMWASIVTEIERRGEQWIVTRLDRNREPLPVDETGFRAL